MLLFALCVSAEAQDRKNIPKIGWLSALTSSNAGQQEIIRILREFGYVNGKNIQFEFRYAANKLDRLPALAQDLVRRRADLLITPGPPSALALRDATRTIPIIFLDATDPVAAGLVDSLARPGGVTQGDDFEPCTSSGSMGSEQPRCSTRMEREPTRGGKPRAAAPLDGS